MNKYIFLSWFYLMDWSDVIVLHFKVVFQFSSEGYGHIDGERLKTQVCDL